MRSIVRVVSRHDFHVRVVLFLSSYTFSFCTLLLDIFFVGHCTVICDLLLSVDMFELNTHFDPIGSSQN
jgi:hypothetical protein